MVTMVPMAPVACRARMARLGVMDFQEDPSKSSSRARTTLGPRVVPAETEDSVAMEESGRTLMVVAVMAESAVLAVLEVGRQSKSRMGSAAPWADAEGRVALAAMAATGAEKVLVEMAGMEETVATAETPT